MHGGLVVKRKVSVRPSVCLYVRLSNVWIVTKQKKTKSVEIFILYERSFSLVV